MPREVVISQPLYLAILSRLDFVPLVEALQHFLDFDSIRALIAFFVFKFACALLEIAPHSNDTTRGTFYDVLRTIQGTWPQSAEELDTNRAH